MTTHRIIAQVTETDQKDPVIAAWAKVAAERAGVELKIVPDGDVFGTCVRLVCERPEARRD